MSELLAFILGHEEAFRRYPFSGIHPAKLPIKLTPALVEVACRRSIPTSAYSSTQTRMATMQISQLGRKLLQMQLVLELFLLREQ